MIEVSDRQELAQQLTEHPRAVALFYASWCPFCRSFIQVFDRYAENRDADVFLKVNVDDDENPMWEEFSLEAVPSIILFEKDRVARRLDCELGAGLNEKQFSDWLHEL
ncbi:MAG: thioredoxin family protein [Candidatus Bathyarchaeia archaeon]